MTTRTKIYFAAIAWFGLSFGLLGCGQGASAPPASIDVQETASAAGNPRAPVAAEIPEPTSIYAQAPATMEDPLVVVHTTEGDITIELALDQAPQTVNNFLTNYVQSGFYEGVIFHHVESGALIAAGGYAEDLSLKPTGAPIPNEANNRLPNVRGSVAMARDADAAHSATSQFFINLADNGGLDYKGNQSDADRGYCVFGKVVDGLDVVDRIAAQKVTKTPDFDHLPARTVKIKSVEQIR